MSRNAVNRLNRRWLVNTNANADPAATPVIVIIGVSGVPAMNEIENTMAPRTMAEPRSPWAMHNSPPTPAANITGQRVRRRFDISFSRRANRSAQ
jgi:hypothetical protein